WRAWAEPRIELSGGSAGLGADWAATGTSFHRHRAGRAVAAQRSLAGPGVGGSGRRAFVGRADPGQCSAGSEVVAGVSGDHAGTLSQFDGSALGGGFDRLAGSGGTELVSSTGLRLPGAACGGRRQAWDRAGAGYSLSRPGNGR